MSKFPAAFLSYFTGNDFYDNVGRNAPATRISIELPAELVDWSSKSGDPPYTPQPVEQSLLAEIQNAVMRKYGGKARNNINAFRQDRGFGDIGFVSRQAVLDGGVGMRWMSQFGNEYVDIRVSPEAVRKLLGEEGEFLYLLILHSNNKISYIGMNSLSSPTPMSIKTKLSDTNWSGFTNYGSTTQLKFAAGIHIVCTPVHFEKDGKISSPPDSYGLYYYNVFNGLFDGVYEAPNDAFNFFNGWASHIPMNGTKDKLFTVYGKRYKFENGKPVLEYTNTDFTASYNVQAISNNGEYWSPIIFDQGFFVNTASSGNGHGGYSGTQQAAWSAGPGSILGYFRYSAAGPTSNDLAANVDSGGPNYNFSGSVSSRIAVYSNNGSVDSVSLQPITANYAADRSNWGTGSEVSNQSLYIAGLSDVSNNRAGSPVVVSGNENIVIRTAYHLGNTPEKMYIGCTNKVSGNGESKTPYNLPFGYDRIEPYIFLADGKNHLSVVNVRSSATSDWTVKIYYNGKDITKKLTNALGITDEAWNIQYMYMDIKLSDIQKLK